MSASTSPDNIVYPVSTDSFGPLETVFATLATSVQSALSATKTYRTADLTSLAAITGMASGALATVIEGGATFGYDGTLWQQKTEALFANTTIRDSAYAKAGGAYKIAPNARVVVAGVRQEWNTLGWSPVGGNDLYLTSTRSAAFSLTANSTNYVLSGAGGTNVFWGIPTASSALVNGATYNNELYSFDAVNGTIAVKIAGTYEIELNVSSTITGSGGTTIIGITKNSITIGATTNDLARVDIQNASITTYMKARNPAVPLLTTDVIRFVALMTGVTGSIALGANPMDGTFRIRRIGA